MWDDYTVIVVTEDEVLKNSLNCLLQSVGISVAFYNRAQDYLIASDPIQHGCLLVDANLSEMSSLQFQTELMLLRKPVPVVVMLMAVIQRLQYDHSRQAPEIVL